MAHAQLAAPALRVRAVPSPPRRVRSVTYLGRHPGLRASLPLLLAVALVAPPAASGSATAPAGAGRLEVLEPTIGTGLVLTALPATILIGGSVTLAATVTPAEATGQVTFTDVTGGGRVELGSSALAMGSADLVVTTLPAGERALQAEYGGDADYLPAVSPVATVTVNEPVATTTTAATTPNPSYRGDIVTFNAAVTPDPGSGQVTWLVDGTSVGTASVLADGTASFDHPFATVGSFAVVARFDGTPTHAASTSAPVAHQVTVKPAGIALSSSANPAPAGTPATITAVVTPTPAGGTILFSEDGVEKETLGVGPDGTATHVVMREDPSDVEVTATFSGWGSVDGTSASLVQEFRLPVEVQLEADRTTAVYGESSVVLMTRVVEPLRATSCTGSVTYLDTVAGVTKTLGPTALADGATTFASSTLRVGTHSIFARYPGDASCIGGDSTPITVTVSSDRSVSVTGVGISPSTFYPYHDSYRDTTSIHGNLRERAAVTIRIYSPAGRLVRTWSLSWRNAGAYGATWNGRTSSGTLLAAGRYRVVTSLRDVPGNSRTITQYVVSSMKRLYWYSGVVTRYADTGAFGSQYYAEVARSSRFAHGVVLYGGWDCDPYDMYWCDYAIGVHRFTLPAAAAYSSIRFAVLGRTVSGYGYGYMSIDDYANDEADVMRTVGASWAWHATSAVSQAGHVSSSRVVTGTVFAWGYNEGLVEYQKVKVTFRYALLR
jgi:hypothetical protein